MHNAFLVHDDIEDASARRRGAPTLHVEHGIPVAIHAGDALAVRAVLPLLDQPRLSHSLVQRVTREFFDTASRTLEGQSMELAWRRDATRVLDLDDYLRLVLNKSCWYTTIYPLRAGCLIGSRGSVGLGPITRFGFLLGAAFQVRDDVLDVAGDPGTHGKERLSDLREGKQTLAPHPLEAGRDTRRARAGSMRSCGNPPPNATAADIDTVYSAHAAARHASKPRRRGPTDSPLGARTALAPAFERARSRFHVRFIEELIEFAVVRPS